LAAVKTTHSAIMYLIGSHQAVKINIHYFFTDLSSKGFITSLLLFSDLIADVSPWSRLFQFVFLLSLIITGLIIGFTNEFPSLLLTLIISTVIVLVPDV
jgi:ABC-type transport system involved in cytochrome c biogenesis permease subunit